MFDCACLAGEPEALAETDPAESLNAYEQAAARARQSGNRLFLTIILPKMAAMLMRLGDVRAALRGFQEMLEGSVRSTDLAFVSQGLGNFMVLSSGLAKPDGRHLERRLEQVRGSNAFVPDFQRRRPASMLLGGRGFQGRTKRGAVMLPLRQ